MPYSNPNVQADWRRSYKRSNQDKINEIKSNNPCADCGGYFHFSVMDFDHLRDKRKGVSRIKTWAWKRIQEEIDKCELVCANCHRLRTWSRSQMV
jgi:hypothetical protein